jgi:hypothetical protein
LDTYQAHVGRVITFEGIVRNVLTSRRGTDYAVMFEYKNWRNGFKMVAFQGATDSVGGSRFLLGLQGRTVRVRGLLVYHAIFGYQIVVTDRKMILNIA